MKSRGFFSVVFVLLFALTAYAETPFVIESAWYVGRNDRLAEMPLTGDHKGVNLKLPEEIPADVPWQGATVTDGKVIGTIIALPLKKGMTLKDLDFMFRVKLWSRL